MNAIELLLAEATPRHDGLIGDHDDVKIRFIEAADSRDGAGDQHKVFGAPDMASLLVQDSVPVQEQRLAAQQAGS